MISFTVNKCASTWVWVCTQKHYLAPWTSRCYPLKVLLAFVSQRHMPGPAALSQHRDIARIGVEVVTPHANQLSIPATCRQRGLHQKPKVRGSGKGHGYGDLEYGILRHLGQSPVPVVTTVHPLQMVEGFPADRHDLPVSIIATPEEVIEVLNPPPAPKGIDWELLPQEALEAMPIVKSLRKLRSQPPKHR
jgi:hypothetical protein